MIFRAAIALFLVLALVWGRGNSPLNEELPPLHSTQWSEKQAIWLRALAGPVPAFAADIAVLNTYNIYAQARDTVAERQASWWGALKYQLQKGQDMDPYFRDIYRLTEGLLAYEAQDMKSAIDILSRSEPYLHSSDTLLAAAFIAHQELKDNEQALTLAKRAISQPDSNALGIGFTTALIEGQSGCKAALAFLISRLNTMPEKYQQGIIRRIRKLQREKECREGI